MSDSKLEKPQKLALFRSPTDTVLMEYVGSEHMERTGLVRISEYTEVTFSPLRDDEVVAKALAALDVTEKKIRNEFQAKLDNLVETRSRLLSLPHKE